MKKTQSQRVAVAMSGGVDSSAAALLMKQQGFDVVGMTLHLHDGENPGNSEAVPVSHKHANDAKRVASHIGIEHHVFDARDVFESKVVAPFVQTYLEGRTPNPCVVCNREIKFGFLFEQAQKLGCDLLVTGHYAQLGTIDGEPCLLRAADDKKDQSYFLFAIAREHLKHLRFPLYGMDKDEVRALARKAAIEIADKKDSQDICFVPGGDYAAFVCKSCPDCATKGDIVHLDGRVLGQHTGIIHYTIGQRRGLGIGGGDPLYVVAIDKIQNTVIVGPKESLACRKVQLGWTNWLCKKTPVNGQKVMAKLRSRQKAVPAMLDVSGDSVQSITLDSDFYGVAPGQACVYYDNDRVLGGGWIESCA